MLVEKKMEASQLHYALNLAEKSVAEQSVGEKKMAASQLRDELNLAEQSVGEQSVAEQSVAEQSVGEQSVAEQSVAEQSVGEQPSWCFCSEYGPCSPQCDPYGYYCW